MAIFRRNRIPTNGQTLDSKIQTNYATGNYHHQNVEKKKLPSALLSDASYGELKELQGNARVQDVENSKKKYPQRENQCGREALHNEREKKIR